MPEWSDMDVPEYSPGDTQGAGTDREYEEGYYLEMLQAQISMMKQRWENMKEEAERENPLSATNMGKINTALAFRAGMENWRDNYINTQIVERGGLGNMEDPSKPGSGLTSDGHNASFRFQKGTKLGKLIGWRAGIEAIGEDSTGEVKQVEQKDGKKEVKEVKNEVVEKGQQRSLHSKDGRKFRSFAKNPRTGKMDKYYTDDNGQKVFQKDYWLELQAEEEAAAAEAAEKSKTANAPTTLSSLGVKRPGIEVEDENEEIDIEEIEVEDKPIEQMPHWEDIGNVDLSEDKDNKDLAPNGTLVDEKSYVSSNVNDKPNVTVGSVEMGNSYEVINQDTQEIETFNWGEGPFAEQFSGNSWME